MSINMNYKCDARLDQGSNLSEPNGETCYNGADYFGPRGELLCKTCYYIFANQPWRISFTLYGRQVQDDFRKALGIFIEEVNKQNPRSN